MTRDSAPEFYDPRHPPESTPPTWPTTPQPVDAGANAAPMPAALPPRRRSVIRDVSAGLFLGDFADDLGLAGAVTQVTISFVPLIGSMCAVRDLVADVRRHDRLGAALNFLALTPILGGFSKTFEVIRSTAHIGHAVHVSRQQAERRRGEQARRRA